jgi:hypothetical protein
MHRLLKLIGHFVLVLVVGFSNAAEASEPLQLKLTAPRNLLVGERPNIHIEITNVSKKPVEFVRPLDGSWHHWRYPHISVEVKDEKGNPYPVRLAVRCGNMDPVAANDIRRLDPAEAETFAIGWPYSQDGFEKDGKYSITLTYDMRAPDIDAWVMRGRFSNEQVNPTVVRQFKRIPRLFLTCQPLTVSVHPITKTMLEAMIAEYFLRREATFVEKDLQVGRWFVSDIRQLAGYVACKVEFVNNYKPTARPHDVTPGYWFEEGHYLFAPHHGTGPIEALYALPDDRQVSAFKLYLPDDAALWAKKHALKGLGFSLHEEAGEDAELLIHYLHQEEPDERLENTVQRMVESSQVICLHYKKSVPIRHCMDSNAHYELLKTLMQKARFSNPVSVRHHIGGAAYPGLHLTFAKSNGVQAESSDWMENMRLPVRAGYRLEVAHIVHTPTTATKLTTFGICGEIVDKIANELDRSIQDVKDVVWDDKTKRSAGEWAGEGWPDYPELSYTVRFARETPETRPGHTNIVQHWCEVKVWFKPETGAEDYRAYRKRTFPKQGISACWSARSTDANLQERFLLTIANSFKPLDAFEKELVVR